MALLQRLFIDTVNAPVVEKKRGWGFSDQCCWGVCVSVWVCVWLGVPLFIR